MKRFHIHVSVKNLEESVQFYSTLFGEKPIKLKGDYAKWLLADPRLNFAISTRSKEIGINHLGIQAEGKAELKEVTDRLKKANLNTFDEGEADCCYAKSEKIWVSDPAGVPWEAYQNLSDIDVFGADSGFTSANEGAQACCVQKSETPSCCG
jgi:catechol-2,3-dioxygenase